MQSHSTEFSSAEFSDGLLHNTSVIPETRYLMTEETTPHSTESTQFRSHFVDCMEMPADVQTVAKYFDAHSVWFRNCAQPMVAEPLGNNGYALVIGRFGSYGYQVEPKIGLHLLPQNHGVYWIETIAIPGYTTPGYDVDFQAVMKLIEDLSTKTTRVEWQLDLTVSIQFPRFIQALPKSMVQNTGDSLLRQIVRQVSNRLTRKVLEDFHKTHGLPAPKLAKRWFFQKSDDCLEDPSGNEHSV
ncbi:MAG: DUF1997 domain-containing protein [Stenomitos frigidus ULC029]